jgi:hypothetical protein
MMDLLVTGSRSLEKNQVTASVENPVMIALFFVAVINRSGLLLSLGISSDAEPT